MPVSPLAIILLGTFYFGFYIFFRLLLPSNSYNSAQHSKKDLKQKQKIKPKICSFCNSKHKNKND